MPARGYGLTLIGYMREAREFSPMVETAPPLAGLQPRNLRWHSQLFSLLMRFAALLSSRATKIHALRASLVASSSSAAPLLSSCRSHRQAQPGGIPPAFRPPRKGAPLSANRPHDAHCLRYPSRRRSRPVAPMMRPCRLIVASMAQHCRVAVAFLSHGAQMGLQHCELRLSRPLRGFSPAAPGSPPARPQAGCSAAIRPDVRP